MLGLPGSGKGTQGKRLAKDLGMAYLATGDLVREVSSRAGTGDKFADEVQARKKSGRPQPDHVIIEILRRKLKTIDLESGIILDAFPISLGQTQLLEQVIKEFKLTDPLVFFIVIDTWECVYRLTRRKFCLKCNSAFNPENEDYKKGICPNDGEKLITRDDDSFHVVRTRIEEYTYRMNHVRNYYERKGWLVPINGSQVIDLVYSEIRAKLAEQGNK